MSKDEERREIARARERADLARLRFGNAVNGTLNRISPERLRADAVEAAADQFATARRTLLKRLRYWPVAAGVLAVGVGALVFWKPARALGRHGLRLAEFAWATREMWRKLK